MLMMLVIKMKEQSENSKPEIRAQISLSTF